MIEHWETLAACDPREREKPQDGRVLFAHAGDQLNIRVCFVATVLGKSLTARLLHRNAVLLSFDRIDHALADRERLLRAVAAPWGVILCTGPTGSGKRTTLYACLNQVTRPDVKVMSIEVPVEYAMPGVVQMSINPRTGLTFPAALRSVLRSAPDVMLVGEIRDKEALNSCYQAALTGHLVLSTLHGNDAAKALVRLLQIGAEDFIVTEGTRLVVAQRLVRLVCPDCSTPVKPARAMVERARQLAETGGLKWDALPARYRITHGCPKCAQTGFRGRRVAEMLEVGQALRRGATAEELRALTIREGMTTMGADAVRRAGHGQTSLEAMPLRN